MTWISQKYTFLSLGDKNVQSLLINLQSLWFQMVKQFYLSKKLKKQFLKMTYFSMYLWKYLSHRNVQYLKFNFRRHCFDHLKKTFALGVIVFVIEIKINVNFFWKKSYKNTLFGKFFFPHFLLYLRKYLRYRDLEVIVWIS